MSEKTSSKVPEEIVKLIQQHKYFVLLTHVHPDGDALGSLLAFGDMLRGMGKNVFSFTEAPVSHLLDFLPECDTLSHDLDALFGFMAMADEPPLTVALDCGESARLGEHAVELMNNRPFLVIDHHCSHRKFGDFRWVEPECSSTGEMLFELSEALGITLSFNAAFDLYVAISTDTGSFRYKCTSARTMQIAASLLELGVQPDEVATRVYDNYTKERLKLMELVLSSLELHADDQLALIMASKKMIKTSGASYQDVEGFVDFPRALKSVNVVAFIKEGKNDMISVSLRSKGNYDVTKVAKGFGGGGHRNAAGFRMNDKTLEEVRTDVLAALQQTFFRLFSLYSFYDC